MARLWRRRGFPVFYQAFGLPDTLEGRFAVLSLHLFAVLHRLRRRVTTTRSTCRRSS